eukprot:TRINITY_DN5594_c0_g1_i6.p1 TRINITY_DN5594_c0_g1~~TRINITY_DN5594_c0_g1_i6.p1  ORF type:complete len:116 (-),score=21.52 TRINITY_DN5594_c0_g1_i6:62-409(-)
MRSLIFFLATILLAAVSQTSSAAQLHAKTLSPRTDESVSQLKLDVNNLRVERLKLSSRDWKETVTTEMKDFKKQTQWKDGPPVAKENEHWIQKDVPVLRTDDNTPVPMYLSLIHI